MVVAFLAGICGGRFNDYAAIRCNTNLRWTDLQARTGRYVLGMGWYVADGEPSIASTNSLNQLHWSKGKNDDLEDQCDDEGEVHGDAEPDYNGEGTSNYNGPCSPFETLIGSRHAQ